MAASVVYPLTASYWAERKPADYKGQDLDKALKSYEGLAAKPPTFGSSLMPATPKSTIGDIDACITKLKSAITDLEKGKGVVNHIVTALKGVMSAAGKTSAKLTKLSKGKDENAELAFKNGAVYANSIADSARSKLPDFE